MDTIKVEIVCEGPVPAYGTYESAGSDVYATTSGVIQPGQRSGLISTGIRMKIPVGYYCNIEPRSGLAHKFGISVLGGIIDSDFRDEVFVILQNNGTIAYEYKEGDRIAQFIFKKYVHAEFTKVPQLEHSSHAGFGSTGK